MKSVKIRLSLKGRIFLLFLCALLLTTGSYLFTLNRFVTNSTHRQLDTSYEAALEEVYDRINSILWTLTLTSQQLLESQTLRAEIDSWFHSGSQYIQSESYRQFTATLYSLTMANADVALISFRLSDKAEPFYSTFPSDNPSPDAPVLYANQEFYFSGPSASQCKIFCNPVLTLTRSGFLSDGSPITLSLESGLYSLHTPLQSVQDKAAYLVLTDYQGNLTYTTFPEDWNGESLFSSALSGVNKNFHVFSRESTQGWSVHILIPDSVYTQSYRAALFDFILCTALGCILLCFIASAFWKSVYHPLQIFDFQLNLLLTDALPAADIHSAIPEYDRLLVKISQLQIQVQEMIQLEVARAKEHSQMQLEKLRAQINPHFLLNTLNTLHWMALMEHQTLIDRQIQALSHLLSYNLDKESSYTSLGKETAALEEYLELQKMRYNFRFTREIPVSLSELDYPCPRFLLQPLVENALIHGYQNDMEIILKIRIADRIHIEVHDTGAGIEPTKLKQAQALLGSSSPTAAIPDTRGTDRRHFGIGLTYVVESLNSFSDGNYHFSVQSVPMKGTVIKLDFPKLKGGGYLAKSPDHR